MSPILSFPCAPHIAVYRFTRSVLIVFSLWIVFTAGVLAQEFGASKTVVILDRKLPAVIQLPGTTVDVRIVSRGPAGADLANNLANLTLVQLQKNDNHLRSDPSSPDSVIAYSVIAYQPLRTTPFSRQETQLQKGKLVQVPVRYNKITGQLTVTYQVFDSHKRALDADTITANYSRDFAQKTNQAADQNQTNSITSKIRNPFSKSPPPATTTTGTNNGNDQSTTPPTAQELEQTLIDQIVAALVPRVVTTDEKVTIMLAKGKGLDEANKLAQNGQWTRDLESLETMTPFSNPAEDAYRLYNIGVANEAMAYQAPDRTSVQKFLDQAAINYGKAIDAKPSEKYFIDPQTRIETAVTHYKKLEEEAASKKAAPPTDVRGSREEAANGTDSAPTTRDGKASGPASGAKSSGAKSSTLTNDGVIKMVKAGVDEESILAAIHDAKAVQFDLSPDGLVDLANNGVKGKLVGAMRDRSRTTSRKN